jgi:branched-chain amino acid transport system ATP-binding protein
VITTESAGALPGGPGKALLELSDLHVYLGESHVLQGISLSVPEGGVTALLGRNGVGKTTTLRSIMGLAPGRGRIQLAGEDVVRLPTHKIVGRGVGYVPEDREIFAGLTVEENLRLAERNGGARYDLVWELFPMLRPHLRQRAGTLSGGEQQMVAIARGLLNDNRVLLVDEPTKGLAPNLVTEVARVLERAAELTTILLVEQNLGVVRRIAQGAVVLDQGRVAYTGPARELLDDPAAVRRLLGVSGGAAA